jgi:hypothetical protein
VDALPRLTRILLKQQRIARPSGCNLVEELHALWRQRDRALFPAFRMPHVNLSIAEV